MTNRRCKTCGTPLDEIPFTKCQEHRDYEQSLPPLTQEELELLDNPPYPEEY